MSENGGGLPKQPQTPRVEYISIDMNEPSPQLQGSYNRYGQFVPAHNEQNVEQDGTQPVNYQVAPIGSLHNTEYKPGTESWETNLVEWTDIGQRYKNEPVFSLRRVLGMGGPLPSDEIRYFQKYGIKFEKQLGSGAWGTVWLVSKTTINKGTLEKIEMACKIVNLKTYGQTSLIGRLVGKRPKIVKEAVERMVSETDLLRKLVHKHIVKCNHVFKIKDPDTGFPYCRLLMFMELCDGDLLSLIKRSPEQKFHEDMAKYMLRQVSEGLQYMHDKHICHLDIKPENILYVIEGGAHFVYKLSDLGLSMSFDSDQQTLGGKAGTFQYMAPEIRSCMSFLPKPADIYALGCVLWQTVVGQSWWTWWLKIREVSHQNPWDRVSTISSVYNISRPCADLILRMTHFNPGNRPTIGEVLKDTWLN